MDQNSDGSDGVIRRHRDGEQKIILPRVLKSPFLWGVFVLAHKPNIPIFQYSNIPG